MVKCDCGGYMSPYSYDSREIQYRFDKKPEDRQEIDEMLEVKRKNKDAVSFYLCVDCDDITVSFNKRIDSLLRRFESY